MKMPPRRVDHTIGLASSTWFRDGAWRGGSPTKLSHDKELELARRYRAGQRGEQPKITKRDLAKQYGVGEVTAAQIISRTTRELNREERLARS